MQGQPIYLEWAPENIFDGSSERPERPRTLAAAAADDAGGGKGEGVPAASKGGAGREGAGGKLAKQGAGGEAAQQPLKKDATVEKGGKHQPAPDLTPAARGAGGAGGEEGAAAAAAVGGGVGTTLYVKNLSFETKEESLKRAMSQVNIFCR
jgi:hypothetical protein